MTCICTNWGIVVRRSYPDEWLGCSHRYFSSGSLQDSIFRHSAFLAPSLQSDHQQQLHIRLPFDTLAGPYLISFLSTSLLSSCCSSFASALLKRGLAVDLSSMLQSRLLTILVLIFKARCRKFLHCKRPCRHVNFQLHTYTPIECGPFK